MAKQNFREIEMDPMERLYYERKDRRKKAYSARQRKAASRNRRVSITKQQIDKKCVTAFVTVSCGSI